MAYKLCLNDIWSTHCHGREHEILLLSLDITRVYDCMSLLLSLLFLSPEHGSSTHKITSVLEEDKYCLFTPLDRQEVQYFFKNTLWGSKLCQPSFLLSCFNHCVKFHSISLYYPLLCPGHSLVIQMSFIVWMVLMEAGEDCLNLFFQYIYSQVYKHATWHLSLSLLLKFRAKQSIITLGKSST